MSARNSCTEAFRSDFFFLMRAFHQNVLQSFACLHSPCLVAMCGKFLIFPIIARGGGCSGRDVFFCASLCRRRYLLF